MSALYEDMYASHDQEKHFVIFNGIMITRFII